MADGTDQLHTFHPNIPSGDFVHSKDLQTNKITALKYLRFPTAYCVNLELDCLKS